jgi:ADP-ribose pyrophosphatase
MKTSKIISIKTVFTSKYFHVDQTTVKRKNIEITKDIIKWNPVVFILPVTKNKEIYLEYQYRDAFQKKLLEIVAGTIETGEDILIAAKRELKEETGLTADRWHKLGVIYSSANIFAVIHVFVALDLHEGKSQLDKDEDISLVKMTLERAIEKAINNEIEVGTHQAVLFKLDRLIQKKTLKL